MLSISLPRSPKVEKIDDYTSKFIIEGCYPGYGITVGSAIRRVLLSSLPGNAIVSVKIKGVTHEFATIKGVMEDAVQLVLNLKKVRFKMHGVEEAIVFLKVKGEKEVKAGDFKSTSEIEVVNKDLYLATLTTASSDLDLEVKVQRGIGFVPVDQQDREEKEIGVIAMDALFSPIKRVNFDIENMRVGKRTDYDKITLEVVTDGSMTPEQSYQKSIEIVLAQFRAVLDLGKKDELPREFNVEKEVEELKEVPQEQEEDEVGSEEPLVKDFKLSTRTNNVLKDNGIEKVSQLTEMTEDQLKELDGMGEKGVKEIRKSVEDLGLTLKS